MKCLDLFCGAGGCTRGYQQAGFYVVGVDNRPQPRYVGDDFIQMDALDALRVLIAGGYLVGKNGRKYYLKDFDLIHASPPCKDYTKLKAIHRKTYPKLIEPTRQLLKASGKPYVIENVPGSPLKGNLLLCGTMFGLRTIRHRIFETWPAVWFPPIACNHNGRKGNHRLRNEAGRRVIQTFERCDFISVSGRGYQVDDGREAMGIAWMIGDELSQAIPPAYTEWIGRQMLQMIKV